MDRGSVWTTGTAMAAGALKTKEGTLVVRVSRQGCVFTTGAAMAADALRIKDKLVNDK